MNAQIITIDKLRPSQLNPRQSLGDLGELEASIRAQGIVEPLIVVPDGNGGFEVVAGGRRLAAAKAAGLKEVPAIVREDLDERGRAEVALIENLQRQDLSPLEEAYAYQRLLELAGEEGSQRHLAERIGVSQGHVSKRLALLELPVEAKRALDAGGITVADAVELTKLKDRPKSVKKVVKEAGTGYYAVDNLVERELQAIKRTEERAVKLEELKAKSVTILKDRPGYEKGQPKRIDAYGDMAHVDARKHAKEPCHAVYVDEWGEAVKYCTEPKNHPRPKEQTKAPRETKAEREKRERREGLDKAAEVRMAFMQKLVAGRVPKVEANELIAHSLIEVVDENWYGDVEDLVEKILQLEEPEEEEPEGASLDGDFGAPSFQAFLKETDDWIRAALAVALAVGEDALTRYGDWSAPRAERHLSFLKRQGYRTSVAEREQLKTAKAER
ncbi:MAG: ParB/RepB/Spo0J family partition protein [Actinomycetota bacterium]